jgi:hypothetical protein
VEDLNHDLGEFSGVWTRDDAAARVEGAHG